MKVSELEGAPLDYWVAKVEQILTPQSTGVSNADVFHYGYGGEIEGSSSLRNWSPSTDWELGGPLLERERIATWRGPNGWYAIHPKKRGFGYPADDNYIDVTDEGCSFSDESLLIAAMRAYVESKFGPDVPDEA